MTLQRKDRLCARRGEVPGLTTTDAHIAITAAFNRLGDELTKQDTEIAELKRLLFEVKDSAIVAERDTLKAEVERLRAENEYRSEEYAKVLRSSALMRDDLAEQRDAAIARAEKAEAENKTLEQGMNHNADIANTARAAHAEAMKLLRKMDAGLPYVVRDPDVLKPLAKYSKDASK